MKTFAPKQSELDAKWLLIDVKGLTLGDVAPKIAAILRGKHKTIFAPNVMCGDFVVVINAKEIKLTGNKLKDKVYHHHSRFPGGLKTVTAGKLLQEKPERVLINAVAGMIPHNKLKKDLLKRLKVNAGATHKNEAQKPEEYKLN